VCSSASAWLASALNDSLVVLQNKQSVPDGTLPQMNNDPCFGLCSPGFVALDAEQRAQRANLCVFPNDDDTVDGTCKKYSCQHFSKSDCGALQPMLMFMSPGATPADYYSCEELICVQCPYAQVRAHPWQHRLHHRFAIAFFVCCCGLTSPAVVVAVPDACAERVHVRRNAGGTVRWNRCCG
jgi:hypothetical protein